MEGFKPCPFCGGTNLSKINLVRTKSGEYVGAGLVCNTCHVQFELLFDETSVRWNDRCDAIKGISYPDMKPCPFCGGTELTEFFVSSIKTGKTVGFGLDCNTCHIHFETRKKSNKWWDKRAENEPV
jgi:transcription elongation factor Elf1